MSMLIYMSMEITNMHMTMSTNTGTIMIILTTRCSTGCNTFSLPTHMDISKLRLIPPLPPIRACGR